MGYWDRLVNKAKSENDQQARELIIKEAEDIAYSIAFAKLKHTAPAREASDKVRERVVKWLANDFIPIYPSPWNYIRQIIRNTLTNFYERDLKEITQPPAVGAKKELAQFDENYVLRTYEGDPEDEEGEGSGWRIFKIIDKGRESELDTPPPYHKLAWILNQLPKYQWWWDSHKWMDNKGMSSREALWEVVRYKCIRRGKYETITNLLLDCTPRQKEVLESHLWGSKNADIARGLDVTDERISAILREQLFDPLEWKEDREQNIYEHRLILLVHNLVRKYKVIRREEHRQAKSLPLEKDPKAILVNEVIENRLFRWVRTSPKMKTWFHDLEKVDAGHLAPAIEELERLDW